MNPTNMQCPDCGSCRRGDGYNRHGWFWLECGRRYNPDTDAYSPPNFYCKNIQLEARFEELHTACLEYLKRPPANVPARREFAEVVTGGSTAPLQSVRDVHTVECTAGLLAGHDCVCGYSGVKIDTEQHECDWELILGRSKADCKTEGCPKKLSLNQIESRLNEYEPLKRATEMLSAEYARRIANGWTSNTTLRNTLRAYADILDGKDVS